MQTSIVIFEIFRSTQLDDLADGIAEDREDAAPGSLSMWAKVKQSTR